MQLWFTVTTASEATGSDWDPQFGVVLEQGTNPARRSVILALAVNSNGDVIIGGSFSKIGSLYNGLSANNLARWNGTQWIPLGSGVNGSVRTVLCVGDDVYVGGAFDHAGDVAATNLARWDGTQWWAVGNGISGASVNRLLWSEGMLFVGGSFTNAGDVAVNNIASWNGQEWLDLGGGLRATGASSVNALLMDGQSLIVGGAFVSAGGVAATNLARWDGHAWAALAEGAPAPVQVITTNIAGGLLVGGGRPLGGQRFISEWDGSRWSSIPSGNPGNNLPVTVLYTRGTNLFTGGYYFDGPAPVAGIVRREGDQWVRITTEFYPVTVGPVEYQNRLYFAGRLNDVFNPLPSFSPNGVDGVVMQQGDAFVPLGGGLNTTSQNISHPNTIRGLAFGGTNLFAAGLLGGVASTARLELVARWDERHWSSLGETPPSVDHINSGNGASAVAINGDEVYLAGPDIGGPYRFDGEAWTTLPGFPGFPWAIAANPDGVWMAGSLGVAEKTPGGWSMVGAGFNGWVYALIAQGRELIAGGDFSEAGGVRARNIARWDGSKWGPLGEGLDGPVFALAKRGNGIVAGGEFSIAGSVPAKCVALWEDLHWQPMGLGMTEGYQFSGAPTPAMVNALSVGDAGIVYAGAISRRPTNIWHSSSRPGTVTRGLLSAMD